MPAPVFLPQMDEMFGHGCGNPFCTHDHVMPGTLMVVLG